MRPALPTMLVPALALLAAPAAAQHESHAHGGLGTVVFPNSGNAAAQQPFLTGIALLHSFEYERAADALRDAQRADPGFALAYWAEALTFSHVLWGMEDLAASRAVLERLGANEAARLAKAGTSRERSFGAAIETFYREGTLAERIMAYADAMRAHAAAAPDDQEAAAFASHALLMASLRGDPARRRELAGEAIGFAQRVATANPEHPGATHYLIHLYDTPGMAAQGLEFARAYDSIAPDAEHALHMPSHIYLQLGLWDDVVNSNERAWAASRAESHDAGELDWHAFTWLQYGYLQQGRYRAARALTDTARALLASMNRPFVDARVALTRLEFQYASETGTWSDAITAPTFDAGPPTSDREPDAHQLSARGRCGAARRSRAGGTGGEVPRAGAAGRPARHRQQRTPGVRAGSRRARRPRWLPCRARGGGRH